MEKILVKNLANISSKQIEKLDQEIEQEISSNQKLHDYIYSLTTSEDVIKKSYPAIRRYLLSISKCEGCKKLSSCPYIDKGIIKELKYEYYLDELEDHFCKCNKAKEVDKVLANIIYSDIDINLAYILYTKVYSLLKTNTDSKLAKSFTNVGKQVISGISKYSNNLLNTGFYIVSDNSNGVNLAIASVFYAAKNLKIKCSIIDAKTIFTDLASLNPQIKNEAKECLDNALQADLICIINLGFEYKNQAVTDSIILPLFLELKRKGKITIISSYYSKDDLINSYFYKNSPNKNLLKTAFNNIVKEKTIDDLDQF